jgi:hypothetical protein
MTVVLVAGAAWFGRDDIWGDDSTTSGLLKIGVGRVTGVGLVLGVGEVVRSDGRPAVVAGLFQVRELMFS